jgi:hypothetical protein
MYFFYKRQAIFRAFQYWSDVAKLSFREVCQTCNSDFVIEFGSHYHGDNYPFDGQGGVLAHAFFPEVKKL